MTDSNNRPQGASDPSRGGSATLPRISAMVLLAGAVRDHPLTRATKRPVLGLPLTATTTIIQHWDRHARDLRAAIGSASMPLLLATNTQVEQFAELTRSMAHTEVVADSEKIRGTGGALADIAKRYGDNDLILVANANAVLLEPLVEVLAHLSEKPCDVCMLVDPARSPSGIMMFRCAALRAISPRGYIDCKEQALPAIAASHLVRVCATKRAKVLRISDLGSYLHAVHCFASPSAERQEFARLEPWRPGGFSIVEEGAVVDPAARVQDSVVLKGSRVERGGVVVRSVIAGRAVSGGDIVVDEPAAAVHTY